MADLLNTNPNDSYGDDAIVTLSPREHIRLRPGMYIGKLGDGTQADDGIYVLIKEVVDNSVDEFIMGAGHIQSVPAITANCPDAQLIHEAAIGKIAGDQLLKLETLGLTPEEAEETILKGFLA